MADSSILELASVTPGLPTSEFLPRFDAIRTYLHTVAGVERSAFAKDTKTPTTFRLFVRWTSNAAHEVFAHSEAYSPFLKSLGEILAGPPTVIFADLKTLSLSSAERTVSGPADTDALLQPGSNPTTEVVTTFFPLDVSNEMQSLCERNMHQFGQTMLKSKVDGLTGIAAGWVLHDTPAPTSGAMSKAYVMLFGWTGMKKYEDFAQGEVITSIKPLFQEVYEKAQATEMQMYHVQDLAVKESD